MSRRYTDSSFTLLVRNTNLSNARSIYVTFSQYQPEDVLSDDVAQAYSGGLNAKVSETVQCTNRTYTSPNTVLVVGLNQAKTAKFKHGYLRVQVNWIDSSGNRHATVVKKIRHRPNIYEEVIS